MGLGANPFEDRDFVARYEDWYQTPFGRIAERVELAQLECLLAPLAPGASVLEIGCGTGRFAEHLQRRGWRVLGCDPAHNMLRSASARIPVLVADGAALPLASGSFDACVMIAVLEFAEQPQRLLEEALRVARQQVVLLTVARTSWLGLRRKLAGHLGNRVFAQARYRSAVQLRGMIEQAGAQITHERHGLCLPPSWAGAFPAWEWRLSQGRHPCAGMLGYRIEALAKNHSELR